MGWVSDDNEPEGWAAPVAPDGRLSGTFTTEGKLVEGIAGRYAPGKTMPDYDVVPDRGIIGWRGVCQCGWRGEMWERVPSGDDADSGSQEYFESAYVPPNVEEAIHEEWRARHPERPVQSSFKVSVVSHQGVSR